jgi:hypothetical protein
VLCGGALATMWTCTCWYVLSGVLTFYDGSGGRLWHTWLRHCATSQKFAGSIPDGVTGIFIDIIILAALWP